MTSLAQTASAAGLPGDLQRLFWDTDPASVRLDDHEPYVISRILSHGTTAQIDWLRATYGDDRLRARLLEPRGVAELPARHVPFWAIALGIDAALAQRWVDEKIASPWGR
ncbi:MAG: hypothetical protein FJ100_21480 [Deltaproteobacteria bacterium]|nr:hypothetical protein [Deltaproteobacteria bacterium]